MYKDYEITGNNRDGLWFLVWFKSRVEARGRGGGMTICLKYSEFARNSLANLPQKTPEMQSWTAPKMIQKINPKKLYYSIIIEQVIFNIEVQVKSSLTPLPPPTPPQLQIFRHVPAQESCLGIQ